ncbi:MAG: hypothetical protein MUE56_07040 [Ignavibacteria bacterium]|nr:hypothetical protein [Ignavibacteria bacterium]
MKYRKIIKIFFLVILTILAVGISAQTKKTDSLSKDRQNKSKDSSGINTLQIDTSSRIINQTDTGISTVKTDSLINISGKDSVRFTNVTLFVYFLISAGGLALFFFLFVKTLFRTFHKTKSTRQSLLLSWSLFFTVSIIWLFIVWGVTAGLWSSAPFMTILIFLFILSLIMCIIALKSK